MARRPRPRLARRPRPRLGRPPRPRLGRPLGLGERVVPGFVRRAVLGPCWRVVAGSGGTSSATAGSGSGGAPVGGGDAAGGPQDGLQAGVLTAGAWDDNLNFGWYLSYLKRTDVSQLAGLPAIPRDARLQIVVTDASLAPVAGARVTVADQTGELLAAPARGDGSLFFFPGIAGAAPGDDLQITATLGGDTATAVAKVGDDKVSLRLAATHAGPPAALDLALAVDTTGSMADELQYLKVEMSNISAQVAADFPGVSQRWALIVYRDTEDAYVVRTFDFTDSLPTFQQQIAAQQADGGGDYPESPDKALVAANALSWRGQPGSGARVLFWIADAPHHVGHESTMVSAFETAQQLGIRIYPIAASGADVVRTSAPPDASGTCVLQDGQMVLAL